MLGTGTAQDYLTTALEALRRRPDWRSVLDAFPVPVYTTDPDGKLTYWNDACLAFAGREPDPEKDRWCVAPALYSIAGEPLAHDQCPMARALREKREIRDELIIAEDSAGRPIPCRPYPTPWFNDRGQMEGAVNVVIELSGDETQFLSDQAARCKRLAFATNDPEAARVLAAMAQGYAAAAKALKERE